jgi:hypothetical protein
MQFARASSDLLMLAPSLSFCPALFVSEALSLQSTIENQDNIWL